MDECFLLIDDATCVGNSSSSSLSISMSSSSSDKTINVGDVRSRLGSTNSTISHSGDEDRYSESVVVVCEEAESV